MSILKRDIAYINLIIVHCSDSDHPEHDNIATIRKWHIEERGFSDVGYHYFVRKNGQIEKGRKIDEIGAHCKNQNTKSIGICLSGSKEFTEYQFKATAKMIKDLCHICYNIPGPKSVRPHHFFNKGKTCPNFDLKQVFKYMDVEIKGTT